MALDLNDPKLKLANLANTPGRLVGTIFFGAVFLLGHRTVACMYYCLRFSSCLLICLGCVAWKCLLSNRPWLVHKQLAPSCGR